MVRAQSLFSCPFDDCKTWSSTLPSLSNRIMANRFFSEMFSKKWCFAFIIIITLFYLIIVYQFLFNFRLISDKFSINLKQPSVSEYIFPQLSSNGVRLVMLDVDASNSSSTQENGIISYGIFEKDRQAFLRSFPKSSANGWNLIKIRGKDYRFMRPTKNESIHIEVITHYFLVSPSSIIHIPVIFPRNNFYWIAGIDGLPANYRYLSRLNYSIPLPMAVEAFNCTDRPAFDGSSFQVCVPDDLDFYRWQLPHARFVECHYEDIVFPFKDKYDRIELIDTSVHSKLMGETIRVAKEVRVPAFLFGGSLLGWYRQCNQIVESFDGDLGILVNEYNQELFYRLFRNKVAKVCCRFGAPGNALEYRILPWESENRYQVDIFLLYPTINDPEQFKSSSWFGGSERIFIHPKRRGVCSAELFGLLVFIPCNYVEIVEGTYGKDGWFPPSGYKGKKLKTRQLEKGEENVMIYFNFQRFDCQKPDPIWGCDPVPDKVINSTYYQKFEEMMKKYAEYWK